MHRVALTGRGTIKALAVAGLTFALACANVAAQEADGLSLVRSGRASEGFKVLQAAAASGDARAQANIGVMLLYGTATPRDVRLGHAWLNKAATAGDPFARLGLGVAYFNGIGVTLNYAEAARHFRAVISTAAGPEALYWLIETPDAGLPRSSKPGNAEAERRKLCAQVAPLGHRVALLKCAALVSSGSNNEAYVRIAERMLRSPSWTSGRGILDQYADDLFVDNDEFLRNDIAQCLSGNILSV